jgi:hypothetical protein
LILPGNKSYFTQSFCCGVPSRSSDLRKPRQFYVLEQDRKRRSLRALRRSKDWSEPSADLHPLTSTSIGACIGEAPVMIELGAIRHETAT